MTHDDTPETSTVSNDPSNLTEAERKKRLQEITGTKPIADLTDDELRDEGILQFVPNARMFTSKQLMGMEFPEPQWVVEGLLPEGLTLLAGKPKTGKSFLCMDFASTVSVGTPALGHYKTKKSGVLYLALEDHERRLQDRFNMIGGLESEDLRFLVDVSRNMEGLKAVRKYVKEFPDVGLVIIDTLAKFLPAFDFNDYSQTYPAVSSLKSIADEFHIAIIATHHTRKSGSDDFVDTVSGSNAFTGAADTIVELRRGRGQADGQLRITGRDIEEKEVSLALETNKGWRLLGEGPEHQQTKARSEIRALLSETAEPLGAKDVSAMLGKNYGTTRYLLALMANNGEIRRRSRGQYEI